MNGKIPPSKHRDLAVLLVLIAGLLVLYHLALALHGDGLMREQHLGTALHYTATQFDIQHTIIVGFNATDTPTILEIPVWQMAAGAAFRLLGSHWWGWANLVSLLLFLPCLYPLFRLAQSFYGDRAAWWTLILFLSQALVFLISGTAGTDGFCLAATIWFWFCCARMLENPVKWFLPAVVLGVVAALSKLPFFMAAGLAAFFLLLKTHGFKWRKLAALAGVGGIAGIVFLLWTLYVNKLSAGAEFLHVDLAVGKDNPSMLFWYFGDWHYRLNPVIWVKAGWRFFIAVFGNSSLILLFIWALVTRRVHPLAKYLLAGAFLTTLLFSHLVLHHHHYYLMYAPAVALLCAVALEKCETFLVAQGLRPRLVGGVAAFIILTSLFQGLMGMRAFTLDKYPHKIEAAIRAYTTPADKLMVINGNWGGGELTHADRRGLTLWDAKVFDNATNYARLKELGFTKLVIISDSPYQNAIQIVNPGQTEIARTMASSYLTPLVATWPTVYETDDIIIKNVP